MTYTHSTPKRHGWPLLGSVEGWAVYERGSAPPFLRLYVAAPRNMVGRFWVTWSLNLGRWLVDSESARLHRRHPSLPAQLAAFMVKVLS